MARETKGIISNGAGREGAEGGGREAVGVVKRGLAKTARESKLDQWRALLGGTVAKKKKKILGLLVLLGLLGLLRLLG